MAEKIRYIKEKKRLTEKAHPPTEEFVQAFVGNDAWHLLVRFEEMLQERYDLSREMKFPFGNTYGWGYRYSHKKSLLLYVFFEENGFCCTVSIGDRGAPAVEAMLGDLQPKVQQDIWKARYACGAEGGWINLSVSGENELPDLVRLVEVKVKPKK